MLQPFFFILRQEWEYGRERAGKRSQLTQLLRDGHGEKMGWAKT